MNSVFIILVFHLKYIFRQLRVQSQQYKLKIQLLPKLTDIFLLCLKFNCKHVSHLVQVVLLLTFDIHLFALGFSRYFLRRFLNSEVSLNFGTKAEKISNEIFRLATADHQSID